MVVDRGNVLPQNFLSIPPDIGRKDKIVYLGACIPEEEAKKRNGKVSRNETSEDLEGPYY